MGPWPQVFERWGDQTLTVFELPVGAVTAAVFTQNRFCAAPVTLARRHREAATPRYLLINTGNANAGTGSAGACGGGTLLPGLAALAGVVPETVLPFSTGVIGERCPWIGRGGPARSAGGSEGRWLGAAATGIMTTDTAPKGLSLALDADHPYTLTGIAKAQA